MFRSKVMILVVILMVMVVFFAGCSKEPVKFQYQEARDWNERTGYKAFCPHCMSVMAFQANTCAGCRKDVQWQSQEVTCYKCNGAGKIDCVCTTFANTDNLHPEFKKYAGPGKCSGYSNTRSINFGCLNGKCGECGGVGQGNTAGISFWCNSCQATGICPYCQGTGTCPICFGIGKLSCGVCGGSGKVICGDTSYDQGGFRKK